MPERGRRCTGGRDVGAAVKRLAILTFLAVVGFPISGCTTAPQPPAKLAVGIACVTRADMPARPAPLANSAMPADVRDREPLYLRQLFDWGTYAGRVDAAVAGCP
nr:hypothetical protein [uncultured organism]